MRLLPDFPIIGAMRAGTTSLFRYLAQHPYVRPALKKEVRFFDRNFARGVAWYRAHFPSVLYKSYFRWRHKRDFITGEATPQYLFHLYSARRAASVVPRAKLIAMLRNPVDRAYSHYHFVRQREGEPLSFEDAIGAEPDRLRPEMEKILADENYSSALHRRYSYLARGIYVDQLKEWLAHFPREQLLVVISEDLFERPAATLHKIHDFLGLPRWDGDQFPKSRGPRYPRMNSSTRDRLLDYFRPHNQRLADFIGIKPAWDH
jgi:hypothetical protein